MLRANVGLSRKLSKDYNSTGYSVNLDGEITAPVSDPEAVFEQVKELFDLAEEVLNQQIDRSNSEAAIASRDEEPRPQIPVNRNGNGSNGANGSHTNRVSGSPRANGTNGVPEQKPTSPPPQNGNGQEHPAGHQQADPVPPQHREAAEAVHRATGKEDRRDHRPPGWRL